MAAISPSSFDDATIGPRGENFGFTVTHGPSGSAPLFDGTANATGSFAVYANSQWQVAGAGLSLAFGPTPVAGVDPAPYGAYTGVAYNWLTPAGGNTAVVTVAKNYANGVDVAFVMVFSDVVVVGLEVVGGEGKVTAVAWRRGLRVSCAFSSVLRGFNPLNDPKLHQA